MTVGSMLLVVLLRGTTYGLQVASLVFYTLFVLFFTFATTGSRGGGNVPGYKFTCPAVEPQIPRLLWRHLICLVALFVLETGALAVHPHLPDWWNIQDKKGSTPFEIALVGLCTFEDLETGEEVVVDTGDARVREHYKKAMRAARRAREVLFNKLALDSVVVRTDQSFVKPIRDLFAKRARRMRR